MRSILTAAVAAMSILSLFTFSAKADPLAVGAPAPAVTGTDQDGKPVNFADIYAKGTTLVYFFPKAETPGCTKEACSFRDSYATLHGRNLQIIGVSRDTVDAQKKFQDKYHLPFILIADTDGKITEAFGVPSILGKLSSRQSFIIKDGKVAWNSLKAKTDGAAQEVQQALDNLK
jgi:thioredoxin-dependent peroxiredoxin